MRRLLVGLILAAAAATLSAQIPDVLVKVDALIHYRSERGETASVRAYDSLGNYGTVGLGFTLEPGFRVLLSQRLQTIRGNADGDQIDELYIEDRGFWRLGKQVMPLGLGSLFRESVYGGRFETQLGWHAVPASLAACDGGRGLQRGLVGRIGSRLGFSFALGERFGIDASSLTVFRRPEDSPGRHRGYKQILGADFSQRLGKGLELRIEHAWLRQGETELDLSKEVTDILLVATPSPGARAALGWSRDSASSPDFLRILGSFRLTETSQLEPILKLRSGQAAVFGLSLRVRL